MKTCRDCGKRGKWPKTLSVNTCEECTAERLKHDTIRRDYFKRCSNEQQCHPSKPPMCASCTKYFASETHAFFARIR